MTTPEQSVSSIPHESGTGVTASGESSAKEGPGATRPASKPQSVLPLWEGLDMGIWADDGTVWLPKALYPMRNDAKKWAVENCAVAYIDVRCRTVWMALDPEPENEEAPYVRVLPDVWTDSEPFECWEI